MRLMRCIVGKVKKFSLIVSAPVHCGKYKKYSLEFSQSRTSFRTLQNQSFVPHENTLHFFHRLNAQDLHVLTHLRLKFEVIIYLIM